MRDVGPIPEIQSQEVNKNDLWTENDYIILFFELT